MVAIRFVMKSDYLRKAQPSTMRAAILKRWFFEASHALTGPVEKVQFEYSQFAWFSRFATLALCEYWCFSTGPVS